MHKPKAGRHKLGSAAGMHGDHVGTRKTPSSGPAGGRGEGLGEAVDCERQSESAPSDEREREWECGDGESDGGASAFFSSDRSSATIALCRLRSCPPHLSPGHRAGKKRDARSTPF
eukprot:3629147-Rhodomonas_salina.1